MSEKECELRLIEELLLRFFAVLVHWQAHNPKIYRYVLNVVVVGLFMLVAE